MTDLARRVSGDGASGAQKTYQSNKRARQKAALAVETKTRVGSASCIEALWRGAKVRQVVAATRKMKAQRAVVEAVVAAARAEQERAAREVARTADQAETEAQAVASRDGGAASRGAARGGATSAMDSLAMISSLAAAEHAAGRGSHSAPSA